jgi:hypothetical protein
MIFIMLSGLGAIQVTAQGVTDSEIHPGQSSAQQGPASALGTGMRAGLEACHELQEQARNIQNDAVAGVRRVRFGSRKSAANHSMVR